MHIAVIGGGAAGFFSAITAKENHPKASVTIFEKSSRPLAKVKISGGGRCNVTNACSKSDLIKAYPRGQNQMKKWIHRFGNYDAMAWFESKGVSLVTQDDQCVFPKAQDSQVIIDCFLEESKRLGIVLKTREGIQAINPVNNQWQLLFQDNQKPVTVDKVIVATGGSPGRHGLKWLEDLGHAIEEPVPSLFSFNIPDRALTSLQGIVKENTIVQVSGTKLKASGPLLITHWGMSGPAILKLSAFGARLLNNNNYRFNILVNWTGIQNQEVVNQHLSEIAGKHPQKQLSNIRPFSLTERLWIYLLQKTGMDTNKAWGNIGKKSVHKLSTVLTNDLYHVTGKSTFKEEFVTCGGISFENVNPATLQSNIYPNLYFAGEVLNIDGITGGFNFQAAWTTGYIAGQLKTE